MRKGCDGEAKKRMMTNVVACWPPEQQPAATLKIVSILPEVHWFFYMQHNIAEFPTPILSNSTNMIYYVNLKLYIRITLDMNISTIVLCFDWQFKNRIRRQCCFYFNCGDVKDYCHSQGSNLAYGWNLPGSTSLLAECHQILCKADVLLGSFFQRNAWILLRSFNER